MPTNGPKQRQLFMLIAAPLVKPIADISGLVVAVRANSGPTGICICRSGGYWRCGGGGNHSENVENLKKLENLKITKLN